MILIQIFIKYYILIIKIDEKKRLKKPFGLYHTILHVRNITYVLKVMLQKKHLNLLCFVGM